MKQRKSPKSLQKQVSDFARQKRGEIPFYFGVPVWGDSYVELLLKVCIPTLLSPNNIPALGCKDSSLFRIYTKPKDYQTIRSSAAYQALSEIIPSEIQIITSTMGSTTHDLMTSCYNNLTDISREANAATIYITPDLCLSDGSIKHIENRLKDGKSIILVAGVRLDRALALPAMLERFDPATCSTNFSGRDLVSTMRSRLHRISNSLFWHSEEFNVHPSHIYFSLGSEGWLAHCFHLHPIAVRAAGAQTDSMTTIDDDLAASPHWRDDAVEIVTDSDDLVCFEFSAFEHNVGCNGANIASRAYISGWAEQMAKERHQEFFRTQILFHSGDKTLAQRHPNQFQARRVVNDILRLVGWDKHGDGRNSSSEEVGGRRVA